LDPLPKILEFALGILSFSVCADVPINGVDAVVSMDIEDDTSPVFLAGGLFGMPSRMCCLLFRNVHTFMSVGLL
jgi:hypothetical protein